MRCERLIVFLVPLVIVTAPCSKETPQQTAPPSAANQPAQTASVPPAATTTATSFVPPDTGKPYDDAITWFRTAPSFHFVLHEDGVHAEGEMKRERVGAESVTLRANGVDWRAASGVRGVVWERRSGNAWTAAETPVFGNRVYQRVTLAFDPQKKEGAPQLVEPGHYRFTDANSGQVHEVWIRDGRIERMTIGSKTDLKITR